MMLFLKRTTLRVLTHFPSIRVEWIRCRARRARSVLDRRLQAPCTGNVVVGSSRRWWARCARQSSVLRWSERHAFWSRHRYNRWCRRTRSEWPGHSIQRQLRVHERLLATRLTDSERWSPASTRTEPLYPEREREARADVQWRRSSTQEAWTW